MPRLGEGDLLLFVALGPARAAALWRKAAQDPPGAVKPVGYREVSGGALPHLDAAFDLPHPEANRYTFTVPQPSDIRLGGRDVRMPPGDYVFGGPDAPGAVTRAAKPNTDPVGADKPGAGPDLVGKDPAGAPPASAGVDQFPVPADPAADPNWLERNWLPLGAGLGAAGLLGGGAYAYWKNREQKRKQEEAAMAAAGMGKAAGYYPPPPFPTYLPGQEWQTSAPLIGLGLGAGLGGGIGYLTGGKGDKLRSSLIGAGLGGGLGVAAGHGFRAWGEGQANRYRGDLKAREAQVAKQLAAQFEADTAPLETRRAALNTQADAANARVRAYNNAGVEDPAVEAQIRADAARAENDVMAYQDYYVKNYYPRQSAHWARQDDAARELAGRNVVLEDSYPTQSPWTDTAATGLGGLGAAGSIAGLLTGRGRDRDREKDAAAKAAAGMGKAAADGDHAPPPRLGPLEALAAARATGHEAPYEAKHYAAGRYSAGGMPLRGAWARYHGALAGGRQLSEATKFVSKPVRWGSAALGDTGAELSDNLLESLATFGDPANLDKARAAYAARLAAYRDEPAQPPASPEALRHATEDVTPRTVMNAADVVARDHDVAAHRYNRANRPFHYWLNPFVSSGPITEIADRLARRGSAEKADPDAALRASLYVPGVPTLRGLLGGHNPEKREKARALAAAAVDAANGGGGAKVANYPVTGQVVVRPQLNPPGVVMTGVATPPDVAVSAPDPQVESLNPLTDAAVPGGETAPGVIDEYGVPIAAAGGAAGLGGLGYLLWKRRQMARAAKEAAAKKQADSIRDWTRSKLQQGEQWAYANPLRASMLGGYGAAELAAVPALAGARGLYSLAAAPRGYGAHMAARGALIGGAAGVGNIAGEVANAALHDRNDFGAALLARGAGGLGAGLLAGELLPDPVEQDAARKYPAGASRVERKALAREAYGAKAAGLVKRADGPAWYDVGAHAQDFSNRLGQSFGAGAGDNLKQQFPVLAGGEGGGLGNFLENNNWATGALVGAPVGAGIGLLGGMFNRKKKRNALGDALTGGLLGLGGGALAGGAYDLYKDWNKDDAKTPPPPPTPPVDPHKLPPGGTDTPKTNPDPGNLGPGIAPGQTGADKSTGKTWFRRLVEGDPVGQGKVPWEQRAISAGDAWGLNEQAVRNVRDTVQPTLDTNYRLQEIYRRAGNQPAYDTMRGVGNRLAETNVTEPQALRDTLGDATNTQRGAVNELSGYARGRWDAPDAILGLGGGPLAASRDPHYDWRKVVPNYPEDPAWVGAAMGGPSMVGSGPNFARELAGQLADEAEALRPQVEHDWLMAGPENEGLDQGAHDIFGSAGARTTMMGGVGGALTGGTLSAARQAYLNRRGPGTTWGTGRMDVTQQGAANLKTMLGGGNNLPFPGPQAAAPAAAKAPSRTLWERGGGVVGKGFGLATGLGGFDATKAPGYTPGVQPVTSLDNVVNDPHLRGRITTVLVQKHPMLAHTGLSTAQLQDLLAGKDVTIPAFSSVNKPVTLTKADLNAAVEAVRAGQGRSPAVTWGRPRVVPGVDPQAFKAPTTTTNRSVLGAGLRGAGKGGIPGLLLGAASQFQRNPVARPEWAGGPQPFDPADLAKNPAGYDTLVKSVAERGKMYPGEARALLARQGITDPGGRNQQVFDQPLGQPLTPDMENIAATLPPDPVQARAQLDALVGQGLNPAHAKLIFDHYLRRTDQVAPQSAPEPNAFERAVQGLRQ